MSDIESGIWQKYKDDGVLVYGLYGSESPKALADFKDQTGITYPLMQDIGYTKGLFDFAPGVGYPYPRDVVIGKDGSVRSIKTSFDVGEMESLVQQLIAE